MDMDMDMDVVVVQSSSSSSRQKSGFKICKPQGTFLWPDDIAAASSSQQVVVPTTLFHKPDLVVPSPPPPPPPHVIFSSTNTTTLASIPLLFPVPPPRRPTSPVKPLAQRRAINVTVSTQRRPIIELAPSESDHGSNCSSITGNTPTTTTTTTRRSHNHSHGGGGGSRLGLIDLNSVPTTTNNNEPGFCGTPTSSFSTYHPPPHFNSLSITNSVSRLREKEMNQQELMVGMEAETKVLMDYYLQQKKKKKKKKM